MFDEHLSLGVAIVLILAYAGNLVYTLVTHRDIFTGSKGEGHAEWSFSKSLGVLIGATARVLSGYNCFTYMEMPPIVVYTLLALAFFFVK